MKRRSGAAIGHLIDTLKFFGQLGIPFRRHRDSGCREPVSDIKDIDTSTEKFRIVLQFHAIENSELAAHLKEYPFNAAYLSPDIQNELITLIGEEILSSISFKVKNAFCFAVIADETTDKKLLVFICFLVVVKRHIPKKYMPDPGNRNRAGGQNSPAIISLSKKGFPLRRIVIR